MNISTRGPQSGPSPPPRTNIERLSRWGNPSRIVCKMLSAMCLIPDILNEFTKSLSSWWYGAPEMAGLSWLDPSLSSGNRHWWAGRSPGLQHSQSEWIMHWSRFWMVVMVHSPQSHKRYTYLLTRLKFTNNQTIIIQPFHSFNQINKQAAAADFFW